GHSGAGAGGAVRHGSDHGRALRRRDHRPQGRLHARLGAGARRGRRAPLPRRPHAARRRGGARHEALLRGDPPRGDPRLRRPRHAPVGDRGERGGARPRLQDRRDRLRRARPGRGAPALAPRLPRTRGHGGRAPPQLARLQPHDGGRVRGHGAVRGRAGHAVGRRGRVRARDVPAQVALPALRGARAAEDAPDGRHLGPLGAHHPPRHAEPLHQVAAGARPRRGRARRQQRRAARPAGHAR
ncbi:MAG: Phytanoyl-CoA dioxygenase, partial [uncultured Gemmatimonadaceae bacterium]